MKQLIAIILTLLWLLVKTIERNIPWLLTQFTHVEAWLGKQFEYIEAWLGKQQANKHKTQSPLKLATHQVVVMSDCDNLEQMQQESHATLVAVSRQTVEKLRAIVTMLALNHTDPNTINDAIAVGENLIDTLVNTHQEPNQITPYNELYKLLTIAHQSIDQLIESNEQRNNAMQSLLHTANQLDAIVTYDEMRNASVEIPKQHQEL